MEMKQKVIVFDSESKEDLQRHERKTELDNFEFGAPGCADEYDSGIISIMKSFDRFLFHS